MTYEKFSELWDEIIGETIVGCDMQPQTVQALIEYGQGNKSKIESVREFLKNSPL